MPPLPSEHNFESPALEAYLLGRIDFDRCLALQQRLVGRVNGRDDGQVCLLLCEHGRILTIGRSGSPGDVRFDSRLLRTGQIEVRWVKRGGGCLVHAPGQLAVYPILPLRWHGFSLGEFLLRFQRAVGQTLESLGAAIQPGPDQGLWGRTGQLAAFGVAIRDWVSYHGAFINVAPSMGLFRLVGSDPRQGPPMSCLMAERRKPVRMTSVRAELIPRLAEAFGCDRYHLYTGHPALRQTLPAR